MLQSIGMNKHLQLSIDKLRLKCRQMEVLKDMQRSDAPGHDQGLHPH